MAITAPTPIAALPAAPDPNDRATFNTRAYPWAAAQAVMVTETNAIAENVFNNATEAAALATTASSQVALASAAANYKGLWSSLSGALNMPASVSHNGNYWALNANLANVTTATPGVSGSWQALNVGAGGATETSSAVGVTLTAASYRVQAVAMTVADKSVTLPAATTLSTGAGVFVIKNTGTTVFCIRDSANTMLAALDPGKIANLSLVNASTSAGVWVCSGTDGVTDALYQAVATAVNASASGGLCITSLTSTTALAVWVVAGLLSAAVLTISGNTVSVGTVFTSTVAVNAAIKLRLTTMSSTQVIVAYANLSNSFPAAVTFNISAGVVTAGAALIFGTVATDFQDVSALSATQAIVIYKGTTGYAETRTLNVSGTTLTAGAILVLMSGSVATPGTVVAISSTQAISSISLSGIITYSHLLTVSGTTVTAGATPCQVTSSASPMAACKVSATQVLLACSGSNAASPRYVLLEVSGATVIARDYMDGFGIDNNGGIDITRISENKFLAIRKLATASGFERMSMQVINIADSALRIVGQRTTIKNSFGQIVIAGVCSLSTTKQLVVFHNTSSFVHSRIVETSV